MSDLQLSAAQHAVLASAIHNSHGRVDWFPDHLKGGARRKVIEGLATRGLIEGADDDWRVTDAGYAALNCKPPIAAAPTVDMEAEVSAAEAQWTAPDAGQPAAEAVTETSATDTPTAPPRRTREHSKQATVIALLKRPEGATIAQVMEATGWLKHTVRGAFAGALKRKLGLSITSTKPQSGDRVYRID